MTAAGIGQIVLYAVVLVALCVPLGAYMARVYTGQAMWSQRLLGPLERLFNIKSLMVSTARLTSAGPSD